MERNELIAEACRIAGLKPGFDREEELYYQEHKVKIYDAFLAGHDLLLTNETVPVPGRIYHVKYKWGNGHKTGIGRINPGDETNTMYILVDDGGCGWEKPENVEIIRRIA